MRRKAGRKAAQLPVRPVTLSGSWEHVSEPDDDERAAPRVGDGREWTLHCPTSGLQTDFTLAEGQKELRRFNSVKVQFQECFYCIQVHTFILFHSCGPACLHFQIVPSCASG